MPRDIAQLVEHLLNMHESPQAWYKLGGGLACNSTFPELDAGVSGAQGQHGLYDEFEAT